MSQRKDKKTVKLGEKIIASSIGGPEKSLYAGHIAYKVPASQLVLLINPLLTPLSALDHLGELENAGQLGTLDLRLVGIQFEFQGNKNEIPNELDIWQVYYFRNLDKFFKYQSTEEDLGDLYPLILKSISLDKMYKINTITEGTENTPPEYSVEESPLDSDTLEANCGHLDFYSTDPTKKPSFAYFSIDQVKHIFEYFAHPNRNGNIIISGYQVDFGKKLGEGEAFKYPYFSLKIEGELGKAKPNTTFVPNVEDAEVAGFAVSIPCPPSWYYINQLYSTAKSINPDAKLPKFKMLTYPLPNNHKE